MSEWYTGFLHNIVSFRIDCSVRIRAFGLVHTNVNTIWVHASPILLFKKYSISSLNQSHFLLILDWPHYRVTCGLLFVCLEGNKRQILVQSWIMVRRGYSILNLIVMQLGHWLHLHYSKIWFLCNLHYSFSLFYLTSVERAKRREKDFEV